MAGSEKAKPFQWVMNSEEPWGKSGNANTSAFEAEGCRFEPCRAPTAISVSLARRLRPPISLHLAQIGLVVAVVGPFPIVRVLLQPLGGRGPLRQMQSEPLIRIEARRRLLQPRSFFILLWRNLTQVQHQREPTKLVFAHCPRRSFRTVCLRTLESQRE